MTNKRQYLSNFSARFGPSEFAGMGGQRALVLGRFVDLSSIANITDYFSIIISEDYSYSNALGNGDVPDVEIWQPGSLYRQSVYSYPATQDRIFMTNYKALKCFGGLQKNSQTYNVTYLPSVGVSTNPNMVRGLPIGLDELAPGVHLAKIAGAVSIWDTEGRSGTELATVESIQSLIKETKYGVSVAFLKQRLPLIDQI